MYLKCIWCVLNCLTAAGMLKAYITRIWTVLYSIWCVFGVYTSNTRIWVYLICIYIRILTYLTNTLKYTPDTLKYMRRNLYVLSPMQIRIKYAIIRVFTQIRVNTHQIRIKYGWVKSESILSKNRGDPSRYPQAPHSVRSQPALHRNWPLAWAAAPLRASHMPLPQRDGSQRDPILATHARPK